MMKSTRLLLFPIAVLLVCVVFPLKAQAACTGSSPNWTAQTWADLQTCVNRAASGDTITLAPGEQVANLGKHLVIPSTKALTLDGNRDHGTIVLDSLCNVGCTSAPDSLITVSDSPKGVTTIRNFYFKPGTATHSNGSGLIQMLSPNAGGHPIRITGNRYDLNAQQGDFIISRTNRALLDHNEMNNLPSGPACLAANSAFLRVQWGSVEAGGASWMTPMKWGALDDGTNNLYVESNRFSNLSQGGSDISDNARVVWRFNHMVNTANGSHGTDTGIFGNRAFELYGNEYRYDGAPQPTCPGTPPYPSSIGNAWIYIRGGPGRILANVLPNVSTGTYWGWLSAILIQAQNLNRNAGLAGCWKGGYPFPGQAGWGWTTGTGRVFGGVLNRSQDLEPIVIAGNTGYARDAGSYTNPALNIGIIGTESYGCQYNNPSFIPDDVHVYIQANRDYYAQAGDGTEQTSKTTPFDGMTGTGYGPRSMRPDTCTTGVYYWATDQGNWNHNTDPSLYMKQGVLDKCENGAWHDAWYVPFVYPHPLDVDPSPGIQADHPIPIKSRRH